MVKSWQNHGNLTKTKQLSFTLGVETSAVRLKEDDKKMTMIRDENGGDPCP
jgi:hypothetical protein